MRVFLPDLAATKGQAQKIAPSLKKGDVLALEGALGAGKTTFARALLETLGYLGEVPSPTFTLLQAYETRRFAVYHFDLYRLKNENELEELGWDEALAEGLSLIEWPERAGKRMPQNRLLLRFSFDENGQRFMEWTSNQP